MAKITRPIEPGGAFITCIVSLTEAEKKRLRDADLPVPARVEGVRALLDTGANSSLVSVAILDKLGLQPISKDVSASGLGGAFETAAYEVRLTLLMDGKGGVLYPTLRVASIGGLIGCDIVVGRDVLQNFCLVYDGKGGTFTLECLGAETPPGGPPTPGTPPSAGPESS